MNDVPRPGNDGARSAQRVPAGSRGPEQAYPDPPRSWTRAGILIGTWVAAWAGVLVFGLGLQAMAQGQDNDRLPFDGQAATREFFRLTIQEHDFTAADQLLCSGFSGPNSEEVSNSFDAAVDAEESGNWFQIQVYASEPQTSPKSYRVTLQYGSSDAPQRLRYLSTTTSQDEDDCISELEVRTDEPVNEPEPDETTEAPGASESVSDFLAHVFRDEDRGAAEGLQCNGYQGVNLDDLLAIPADHVHEGGGETLYERALNPRVAPDGMEELAYADFFHATVNLDRDTHEFMVVYDPQPGKQCIAAVFDDW